MLIALSIFKDESSRVFDFTEKILIIKTMQNNYESICEINIDNDLPETRIKTLLENDVDVLICGAISNFLYRNIQNYNILIIPFISGDKDDVISAYLNNNLDNPEYFLPGCHKRCRYRKGNIK